MKRLPHPRFFLFLAVFGGVLAAAMPFRPLRDAVLLGFDAGALAFLAATVPLWFETRTDIMRSRAARDDGGRVLLLLVSVVALLTVFAAVFAIVASDTDMTVEDMLQVVGTLALAWLFVNTIFALHYGHLYYDPAAGAAERADRGGLAFPGDEPPVFSDFVYFAFVIGMASQVSDVAVLSRAMRRTVILHGLLAFAFNLGILAMTINVLSGTLT
jgi:uncharacterized membrane protein